ncbi:sulfurtransferase [Pontibacter rugosus]|uniref:Sulfurtransferase n=1 Tax=Pontibacter rugosus TaxID=1745966 RepID=A0ABW3SV29_9BACT
MKPIIKPQELICLLQQQKDVVLIDARTGPGARQKYEAEHLAGALYVDLEKDLAHKRSDPSDGGRHPLPTIASFAQLLGILGIHPESHVVVYDDKNGANAAARFWWMLRAIGHSNVQVLEGGYIAAHAADVPVSSGAETAAAVAPYSYSNWKLPTASITKVAEALQEQSQLVIDVRDPERFRGETEPIDLVAGHIPGAINVPFNSNLDSSGSFLAPEVLHAKYKELLGNRIAEDIVVHCGSGVTACHTLLAMNYAGLGIPQLYVGSWSEWSRSGRPIATEG